MLTAKAEIISEVSLHDILTKDGSVRPRCHGLLAHSQSNHGRVMDELLQGRIVGNVLLPQRLMDVVRNVVAGMHGTATAFDARPLCGITSAEVEVCVGRVGRESEAVTACWLSCLL